MRPLDGVRVVDLTEGAQGPFAASLLADLGAEVVKVERPGGEFMRKLGPFHNGVALPVLSICRGRYAAVELDVKNAADFKRILDLVSSSDIMIQNWKAGTDERLGLSFEAVQEVHPTIVYVRSNGYGTSGPYGTMGAMDSLSQAISGMSWLSGDPSGTGERTRLPVLDFVSAFVTAEAAVIGLIARRQADRAVVVESSQMSAALDAISPEILLGLGEGVRPSGQSARHSPLGGYFQCADGHFVGFECEDEEQLDDLHRELGVDPPGTLDQALLGMECRDIIDRLGEMGICARRVERRFEPHLFDDFPGAVGTAIDNVAGPIIHSQPPWIMECMQIDGGRPLVPVGYNSPLLDELIDMWSKRGRRQIAPEAAAIRQPAAAIGGVR